MSDEKKVQEAIASMMKDPSQREALASIIVEYVQPNHLTTDFISGLLNTRSLQPGDALVKKLRKGIEVRTLVPGSIHLAQEITVQERMNYILDGADVKVTYNAWEIESGEIGTVQEIRNEMARKLNDFYINKVFSALSTVWSGVNTPDNYTAVGGVITNTALEAAINQINKTTPGAMAIVGSRAALTPITKFAAFWAHSNGSTIGYSETALDQIRKQGWIGEYYGVPIRLVEQSWDNAADYNKLVPEDKVLVIGQNVGEFITYGEVKSKQWTDMNPTPPQWFLEIYQQFGMIIDNAMGIYVLGSIS
jgi:hypothetical protein